ncbi:unnamed protein product [Blumeria hordei]|uniref:Ubiquitin-like-conjugating enzyme ATG10 n=2 Tax=Blumeria hordei TaxID=2867405 RepID=A0A383US88_BLUHO|nr:hypothetical protein BGHDH14_bgh03031 [Blumeria hordei DH14]SZF03181.1 unnamed protein product [Blumeria hordei]
MSHRSGYKQWPFVTKEEFDLACAFLDQRYVRAELGGARRGFKLRCRRVATTGTSFIEILRPLKPCQNIDELSFSFDKFTIGSYKNLDDHYADTLIDTMVEDMDEEALRTLNLPPRYKEHSSQPYVIYEIHLHPTYNMPTLWFTLHDLNAEESGLDLEVVYRYLVQPQYQLQLRSTGIIGALSAAPNPVTGVPAFFIHPCQTKEAMDDFNCPLDDYLSVWIGIVGGCIGLWLPPEIALVHL